jgi:hypothetical protein
VEIEEPMELPGKITGGAIGDGGGGGNHFKILNLVFTRASIWGRSLSLIDRALRAFG